MRMMRKFRKTMVRTRRTLISRLSTLPRKTRGLSHSLWLMKKWLRNSRMTPYLLSIISKTQTGLRPSKLSSAKQPLPKDRDLSTSIRRLSFLKGSATAHRHIPSSNSLKLSICRINSNSNTKTTCSHRETYRAKVKWGEAWLLASSTMARKLHIITCQAIPWFKKMEGVLINSNVKRWEKWFLEWSSNHKARASTIL